MKSLLRPCPICTHGFGTVVHHQEFLAPDELNAPAEVDIVSCARCGLVFSDLDSVQSEIDLAYEQHSKYADTSLYENEKAEEIAPDAPWDLDRLEKTAAFLASRAEDRSVRVLDAGCATGSLLGFLKRQGFTNLVGLDPSPMATATAHRLHEVETVAGSFITPPPGLGHFDVIVLSHVLEHLLDVRAAVASMFSLLSPGGLVYLEMPDATRYTDCLVAPFHDFNTEHINHFSPRTLRLLMDDHGFREVEVGRKTVLCSPTDPYPALYGIWQRPETVTSSATSVSVDDELAAAIADYIQKSTALMARYATLLDNAIGEREVVLWGAGQLSMKLLAGPLRHHRVHSVIDSSTQKQGLHLGEVEIRAPEAIKGLPLPIVVGSVHHQASIVRSIREEWGSANPLVLLRPDR